MYYEKMEVNENEEIIFTGNPRKAIAGIPRSEPRALAEEIVRRWNDCNTMPQDWVRFVRDLDIELTFEQSETIGEALFKKLRNGEE